MNTRSVQRTLLASSGLKALPVGALGDMQEPGMRIGIEYQADVPDYTNDGDDSISPGSLLLWKPTSLITDNEIDGYLKMAKDQYSYNIDQALGMLYYHGYDIELSVADLPNFCPLQEEWSMEDKVVFEQAFRCHGKNFQRIRSMLPDKPVSTLVKYYYLWKRAYSQYSLLDKHSRRNGKKLSNGLPPSNEDDESIHSGSTRSEVPPLLPPVQLVGKGKQLPKGIYMSTGELSSLASEGGNSVLKQLDKDILELKEKIQTNKQELLELRDEINNADPDIELLRPVNYSQKLGGPTRWSDDEISIALEIIAEHGKNVEALSGALNGKTVSQCRNFFTNYKHKLNLPRRIAEYELKHGHKVSRYSRHAAEQIRTEQVGGGGTGHQYGGHDLYSITNLMRDTVSSRGSNEPTDEYNNDLKRPRIMQYQEEDDEEEEYL